MLKLLFERNVRFLKNLASAFVIVGLVIVLFAYLSLNSSVLGYSELYLQRAMVTIGVGIAFELAGISLILIASSKLN